MQKALFGLGVAFTVLAAITSVVALSIPPELNPLGSIAMAAVAMAAFYGSQIASGK